MESLDSFTSLLLVSQREFPTAASIVGSLVLVACARGASRVLVRITSSDSFTTINDGIPLTLNEVQSMWRLISGIASLEAVAWDIQTHSTIILDEGWLRASSATPTLDGSAMHLKQGCQLRVSRIFERLPVRRRIQHSDSLNECQQMLSVDAVLSVIKRITLQYPEVDLVVEESGPGLNDRSRTVLKVNASSDLRTWLMQQFGEKVTEGLKEVRHQRLHAFISANPNGLHHSKRLQLVVRRGYLVCNEEVDMIEAMNQTFRKLHGREFVQLTNIHNRAKHLIFAIVLLDNEPWSKHQLVELSNFLIAHGQWQDNRRRSRNESSSTWKVGPITEAEEWQKSRIQSSGTASLLTAQERHHMRVGQKETVRLCKNSLRNAQVIGQLNNEVIVVKAVADNNRLLLIDQHAADERVRFERLQNDAVETRRLGDIVSAKTIGDDSNQGVLISDLTMYACSPLLRMTSQEWHDLEAHQDYARSWGFTWVAKTNHEILVTSVPSLFGLRVSPSALLELIDERVHNRIPIEQDQDHVPLAIKRLLASRACRGAIMFGQPLTEQTCQRLLSELSECKLPFQCAHGRPTVVPAKLQLV